MTRSGNSQQKSVTQRQIYRRLNDHIHNISNVVKMDIQYKNTKNIKQFILIWEDNRGVHHKETGHYTQQCVDHAIRNVYRELDISCRGIKLLI